MLFSFQRFSKLFSTYSKQCVWNDQLRRPTVTRRAQQHFRDTMPRRDEPRAAVVLAALSKGVINEETLVTLAEPLASLDKVCLTN